MNLVLSLPFPPSVNTYYRRGQHSTYLSKPGRAYKQAVAETVAGQEIKPLEGRLTVFLGLCAPTKRAYDIDNRIKAVLDALQDAGVYEDDGQIDYITVSRIPPQKGGYCSVVICKESNGTST